MINSYPRFRGDNPFASQAKMLLHLDRVQEYLQTGDTAPIFMEVNLTNRCNMKCQWCISENFRGDDQLDKDVLSAFFGDFIGLGGEALTFSGGGEPTFHPDFVEITEAAHNTGIELGLMTNGLYHPEYRKTIAESFQWVRFSLDTVDPKKYKKWKGVDGADRVIANIMFLKKYGGATVGVNCNVTMEHTKKDVTELIWAVEEYADYIQFRPILPRYFKGEMIQLNEKVWSYLKGINHPKVNLSDDKLSDLSCGTAFPFRSCEGHFFSPILNANGDVCVCMYHPKDPRFVFGNINEKSFTEIWVGKKRWETINRVREIDYKAECQMCCKLTELNKFLDFVRHPEEMKDVNFL